MMSNGLGVSTRRSVSHLTATALTYRVLVRQVITPARLIALGLLGALMVVVGWVVRAAADPEYGDFGRLEEAALFADGFGLIIVVPIVSLVFGSSVLGETREDGTLVYLWLRPMARGPVVVGAAAAAISVALPFTVIPTVVAAWIAAGSGDQALDLIFATLVASGVGTIAYSCGFVLVGLVLRRAIMWGIVYILAWEGLAASLGEFAAQLSLRGYTRSLLSRIVDIDLGIDANTTSSALIVLVVVTIASLFLSSIRLSRLDVD